MNTRFFAGLPALPILLLSLGCGGHDGDRIAGPEPVSMMLDATSVTSDGVTLVVTSTASMAQTPLWRTDVSGPLARVDLRAGAVSTYIDHDVVPGGMYCYMAGGDDSMSGPDHSFNMMGDDHGGDMMGSIHSNEECVTLPRL